MAMVTYSANDGSQHAHWVVPTPKRPEPKRPEILRQYPNRLPDMAYMPYDGDERLPSFLTEIITDPRAREWAIKSRFDRLSPLVELTEHAMGNRYHELNFQCLKILVTANPILLVTTSRFGMTSASIDPLFTCVIHSTQENYVNQPNKVEVLKLLLDLGAKQRSSGVAEALDNLVCRDVAVLVGDYSQECVYSGRNLISPYVKNLSEQHTLDENLKCISLLLDHGNAVKPKHLEYVSRILRNHSLTHPPSELGQKVIDQMKKALIPAPRQPANPAHLVLPIPKTIIRDVS